MEKFRVICGMRMSCNLLYVKTRGEGGVIRETIFNTDNGFLAEYWCFSKLEDAINNELHQYGWSMWCERPIIGGERMLFNEVVFYDDEGNALSTYDWEDNRHKIRIEIEEKEWQNILLLDYEQHQIRESEGDWKDIQMEMLEQEGVDVSDEELEEIKNRVLNKKPDSIAEEVLEDEYVAY